MSSRGVLVSKDSFESLNEFPVAVSSPPLPRTPRSPHPPYGNRSDYFDRTHRGNVNIFYKVVSKHLLS